MRRIHTLEMICMGLLATLAAAQTAAAGDTTDAPDQGPIPEVAIEFPVVMHQKGHFNGKEISYTATVDALDVLDGEGRPGARVVSFAYTAENIARPSQRPVMFVFNGGPISPSLYLHMGAFGPRRVAFADDLAADPRLARTVENPYSILDVADLVYFDPAGTGFSRAAPGKELSEYFSVAADAQQTAAFIAAWLKRHGRLHSPAYICGESYGTMRAPETARMLAEMPDPILLDGMVLLGQAVNIIEYAQRPDNIISYVVSLPTLAALGWYHGKVNHGDNDLESFVAAAQHYAATDYLQVLFRGNTVPQDELQRSAERLQAITGLRSEYFLEKRLRVSKEDYRAELLKDEGLLIGRSDGRYVAPMTDEGGRPDPAAGLATALQDAFIAYLRDTLGIEDTAAYVISSPVQELDGWDFGGKTPFARWAYARSVSAWLEKNPRAVVLVGTGYFDTMTTIGSAEYLVDQEDWPRDRVMLKTYYGGHMPYSNAPSAEKLAADLREMIEASQ